MRYADLTKARERLENELTEFEALAGLARKEITETQAARDELRTALRDELIRLQSELEEPPTSEATTAAELSKRISARLRARGVRRNWHRSKSRHGLACDCGRPSLRGTGRRQSRQFRAQQSVLASRPTKWCWLTSPRDPAPWSFCRRQPRTVRAYASAMSCGDIVRRALDPSILCADDLWRQPAGRSPTAFANAWAAASLDARRFRVVLLDGLHIERP